ncbi:hypothetical protein GALL_536870 [mine drainage metagenome]|uniref:Uncharacterized protein n=1 Tax=mine drainage metagenome TaxID=410659 RepID=A0A1J5P294_9ZZZZ
MSKWPVAIVGTEWNPEKKVGKGEIGKQLPIGDERMEFLQVARGECRPAPYKVVKISHRSAVDEK